MIDFVKIKMNDFDPEIWYSNNTLGNRFQSKLGTVTGELIEGASTAEIDSLKFKVYANDYCEVTGSLHKFHNGGKHNADDFTYHDLEHTLDTLEGYFDINPTSTTLINMEYGVNIEPPIPSQEILDSLMYHKGKPFDSAYGGNMREAKHSHSFLKVYDKKKQYQLSGAEILRVENKPMLSKSIAKLGVARLGDLYSRSALAGLGENLINVWGHTHLTDPTFNIELLSDNEKAKYMLYSNNRYWVGLKPYQRCRHKKRHEDWNYHYSDNIKQQITERVGEKWHYLLIH